MNKHHVWVSLLAAVALLPVAGNTMAPGGDHGKPLGTAPSLQWTWGNPTPSADKFTVLVQGAGLYVAAGQDGVIYTSPDGTTWTPESSVIGEGGSYQDAVFGNGLFVLAGMDAAGGSHVTSSSDGIHWTDTALSVKAGLTLAYGNSAFVVMGSDSTATSPDGVNWTVHASNFTPITGISCISSICVSAGYVGSNSSQDSMFFSTDNGATWSKSGSQNLVFLGQLSNNGSTFFLFGSLTSIYTSTDGNLWTKNSGSGSFPDSFLSHTDIYWDGTQFLTTGSSGGFSAADHLYASTDGLAWTDKGALTSISVQPTEQHQAVNTGSGYLAVGSGALQIIQSTDFNTWTSSFSGSSGPANVWSQLIYGNGHYVAVGETPSLLPAVMQSTDGVTWSGVYTGRQLTNLTTAAYGNGVYVAAGVDATASTKIWTWVYSTDATNWSMIGNPGPVISDLAYGAGEFVAFVKACPSNCSQVEGATSKDGLAWVSHSLPAAFIDSRAYANIGFNNGKFIALGSGTSAAGEVTAVVYVSSDGVNWTNSGSFPVPLGTSFSRVRALGTGFGAVGSFPDPCEFVPECGSGTNDAIVATSADGANWTVSANDSSDIGGGAFTDITYTGHEYLAAYPQGSWSFSGATTGSFAVSTDGIHWCQLASYPMPATSNTLVINGNRLAVADGKGDILSTNLSAGTSGPSFACSTPLFGGVYTGSGSGSGGGTGGAGSPTGGGGGEFGLLTISALLGFAAFRRRRWGRG